MDRYCDWCGAVMSDPDSGWVVYLKDNKIEVVCDTCGDPFREIIDRPRTKELRIQGI